ncbi:recombinase family protein, partial [Clostridium butyricum]|uniref:recombinase family protein n=1 Tax=Clostridium butyricum TaxID=1492 RepID=UPI003464FD6B
MKAAIYTRKSKFTEEGESIENQINMCIKYADNILGITDYEVYEDEGFSGGNIDRPQFKKLMRDIKTKKFTHLICYRLDRISRNVADFTTTLEILNKYECSFVSIKEQFDTSSAMGRAMMNISATFAQLERETIAERIKDNLRELSKTGRWLGGPAPMGYKSIEVENNDSKGKSRKKHILEINPNEIETIKLVFKLFIKYKSFQRVSRELEKNGIYSRSGTVFSRELVKQAISNPIYVIADKQLFEYLKSNGAELHEENKINGKFGAMPYNRRKENGSFAPISSWIVSVGDHPGIVDSATWIECQHIQNNIKLIVSNRQCTSEHALLSGLVICGHCGASMAPRKQTNKLSNGTKTLYRYYTCNLKNKSATRCDNKALNAYDAEDYVVNKIKSTTQEDIMKLYLSSKERSDIKFNNNRTIEKLKNQIKGNEKSISSLIRKVSTLDETVESQYLIQKNYESEILKLSVENKQLDNKIIELENQNENISDLRKDLSDITELYENFKKFYDYTESFEDKKRLIRSVVKFVVWDSDNEKLDIIPVGSSLQRSDFGNLAFRSKEQ